MSIFDNHSAKNVVLRNSCKKIHNFCMFAKTEKQTRKKNEILYPIGKILFLLHPDPYRDHGSAGGSRPGRTGPCNYVPKRLQVLRADPATVRGSGSNLPESRLLQA